MNYRRLLAEFMSAVEDREGAFFVKDIIIWDLMDELTPEERNALYEIYLEV